MSEGDLSDSDWLEISSNRESDDNDSVMSGDSDRDDVGSMPLSRRSSISVGSSRDGDVEAWEGFVDDSSDGEPRTIEPDLDISVPAVVADDISMGASELTVNAENDLAEEQRVKEGLDQSMISTLSGSRSSSASVHTSLRDLRLSFPDPLTSSHDELNRSFEQVFSSDMPFSATDVATDVPTDDATDASMNVGVPAEPTDAADCKEDPGSLSSTPEVSTHEVPISPNDVKAKFEVVLYGAPSDIKWSFVQDLVRSAILASSLTYTDVIPSTTEPTRHLNIQSTIGGVSSISHFIPVHDRTGDIKTTETDIAKYPSLAVLYLPASIHALPEHTLYLPVLVPSSPPHLSRITAANDWKTLSIPPNKVARLSLAQSPIFDSRETKDIQDTRALRLFQRLVSEAKKRQAKSLADHLSPAHAVTLFALMSLIVGFAMNTAFRRPSTPTPTASTPAPANTYWGMFGPQYNETSVSVFAATSNSPAIATNKEFSLSIINPGTTSLSITSNAQPVASTSDTHPKVDASQCESSASWTDNAASTSTDVLVRPGTQMSVDAQPSLNTVPSSLRFDGASSSKALNVVAHSISEVLDSRVSRLRTDFAELVGSLDELSQAIHRQTKKRVGISKGKAKQIRERAETISKGKAKEIREHVEHLSKGKAKEIRDRVEQSKRKAKEFRETVQYRHERARGKAKELRRKGEDIIYAAGEQIIGRTTVAKKKARDIGDTVANSEPWRSYQKVHADWVRMLKEKGHGNEGGQNRRRKPTGRCRETGQTASAPSFFSWSYADIYLA
ncbi:hypothetical protein DXG03_008614 [Asterophora parasitica]|uniref:Uncharacterized protein n=1 Tax=Asterophora parasitica TaxID=117018 RepID=A0A9P7KE14_9AGAR|nr:hypothetical protein DXG03_008614 [Asterophora parasitica]